MEKSEYRKLLRPLDVELLKMQRWIGSSGARVLAIFEGRDAAGKGGTIKRIVRHLNPRGCRVVALGKRTGRGSRSSGPCWRDWNTRIGTRLSCSKSRESSASWGFGNDRRSPTL